jgi:5-methylcytosine-specific restriction endonuclease McrA
MTTAAYMRAWTERHPGYFTERAAERRRAAGTPTRVEWLAAKAALRERHCRTCGKRIAERAIRYCRQPCMPPSATLAITRELICDRRGCGARFTTRIAKARYCTPLCRRRATRKPKELRSRSRFRQPSGPIRTARLRMFERDGWICWLCREAVDPALRWPDGRSASLDHVVPLSQGGVDDESNLRLAHLDCNAARGVAAVAA